ncbi:hypothetical protein [Aeoliella sp.]|uniref:hypothetical protein n=1 Tax=Aeoliella sp. TaxID=2795800 RepID=UPI003CCBCCBD
MSESFHLLEEPLLEFGETQTADDPHDGLALFGPAESSSGLPDHVAIGTPEGLDLWNLWVEELNSAAACDDAARHRPWPPFPGYEVAFGSRWPSPAKSYALDASALEVAAMKADRHERVFAVSNLFLEPIQSQIGRLDSRPALAVCIAPDHVYKNCRPKSYVSAPSDEPKSQSERRSIGIALDDRRSGQSSFDFVERPQNLEQYGMSPDFRRQIKARVMEFNLPVQIVRESTLAVTKQVRNGEKGVNPLSDRLWNIGTALFYKCGRKPWKTPWAREGVCYVGLAYRQDERDKRTACCAAQMFLDSGDGIVFVGEFGPWYSELDKEFHLTQKAAEGLLRGTIETYMNQDGRKLTEIFLHARSGLNDEEFAGFSKACPQGVKLVGIRVRKDRLGPRLFRHDDHPEAARRGKYPVLRGTLWQQTKRHGLLFTSGFKPRIASYDGWEIPVPLSITIQHGEADLIQVATDILGLTKLNYNACRLGESQPITVKYSDRIGEILLANPEVPRTHWKHNFKFYI